MESQLINAWQSGTKKEPKPKLLSPDIFWWGGGLPREGVGAKKFGMSLETQGIKLFGRDIPGFCRDIPEAPEKFEKKMFGFNSRPLGKSIQPALGSLQLDPFSLQCSTHAIFIPKKHLCSNSVNQLPWPVCLVSLMQVWQGSSCHHARDHSVVTMH